MELDNCPVCGSIFYKNQFNQLCPKCKKEEEKLYDTVYQYMRKRENRAATMNQIVEATGVPEETILKFIKTGRLKIAQFPNLGYPCDKCGKVIRTGKLCEPCSTTLKQDLDEFDQEQARKKAHGKTYLSRD